MRTTSPDVFARSIKDPTVADFFHLLFAPERALSDYFLLAAFVAAAWFALSYAIFSPWYKVNDHGWIGVMTLLHSWSVAALLFLMIAHMGGSILWVFSTVLLQKSVEDQFRGRVFAAEMALVTLTMAASMTSKGATLW